MVIALQDVVLLMQKTQKVKDMTFTDVSFSTQQTTRTSLYRWDRK